MTRYYIEYWTYEGVWQRVPMPNNMAGFHDIKLAQWTLTQLAKTMRYLDTVFIIVDEKGNKCSLPTCYRKHATLLTHRRF